MSIKMEQIDENDFILYENDYFSIFISFGTFPVSCFFNPLSLFGQNPICN